MPWSQLNHISQGDLWRTWINNYVNLRRPITYAQQNKTNSCAYIMWNMPYDKCNMWKFMCGMSIRTTTLIPLCIVWQKWKAVAIYSSFVERIFMIQGNVTVVILFHYFWVYFTYLNAPTLWYFVFLYLIFLSQQVLYFLLSTLVLTLYIDVVLSFSITSYCVISCVYWIIDALIWLSIPQWNISLFLCI